jgi:hypothetical protein
MLKELLGDNIVEHEIVILCRFFSIHKKRKAEDHRELIRSVVHGEINRGLWDDMDRLKEFIYHVNPEKLKYLPEQKIWIIIRACKIPLDPAIVQQLLAVLEFLEM